MSNGDPIKAIRVGFEGKIGRVTRWLNYVFNIWPFTKKMICQISKKCGYPVILALDPLLNRPIICYQLQVLELESAFVNDDLPSSTSFFQSRPRIEASEVYKFIHDLPKGGALHLHEFAITSIDWVVSNITYRDNLYSCFKNSSDLLIFGWFDTDPEGTVSDCNGWKSAKVMRETMGAGEVDKYFKDNLSIVVDNPEMAYPNVKTVWAAFAKRFGTLMTLLNFKELARDYFYQGMKEFYEDGVQYMEVRAVFAPMCESIGPDCVQMDIVETVRVFKAAAEQV